MRNPEDFLKKKKNCRVSLECQVSVPVPVSSASEKQCSPVRRVENASASARCQCQCQVPGVKCKVAGATECSPVRRVEDASAQPDWFSGMLKLIPLHHLVISSCQGQGQGGATKILKLL